jgi:hypothetical protein
MAPKTTEKKVKKLIRTHSVLKQMDKGKPNRFF